MDICFVKVIYIVGYICLFIYYGEEIVFIIIYFCISFKFYVDMFFGKVFILN